MTTERPLLNSESKRTQGPLTMLCPKCHGVGLIETAIGCKQCHECNCTGRVPVVKESEDD